ncbi:C-type lectin domain family 2 member D3-like [Ambystoma mexicanum]|uniref:C-type lectin domain family 2 member D3-like n=1 Tax=Ambystoma mexicanum TaxID=8296 RepID=UPI0037E93BB9
MGVTLQVWWTYRRNLFLGRRKQASSNAGLPLYPVPRAAEVPTIGYNHKLTSCLRRATETRFLAVYLAGLVLVILALGVYIAVLKSSQCPDPQAHATDVASSAENPQDQATGVASNSENANREVLPPCGEGWIWFRSKWYFFSEAEANWTDAEHACASLHSSLAVIDNQREMDFVMRYKGEIDHWIGLRRDSDQPWRWVNGTEFSNWFEIRDYSECAFLNTFARSSGCHSKMNWICTRTKAPSDARKRKRSAWTRPHFH